MEYKGLHVGAVQIDDMRSGYPNEFLVVFRDDMLRTMEITASEYDGYIDAEDIDTITVCQYVGHGSVIADRLDVLGFSPATTHDLLTSFFADAHEHKDYLFELMSTDGQMPEDLIREHEAESAYLDGYTGEHWVQDLREAAQRENAGAVFTAGSLSWLLSVGGADPRVLLRAALLAWPDAEVHFDVTDYEDSAPLDTLATACSDALDLQRQVGSEHAPVVVLTEGKTDVRVLESALRLLYPHLTDLIRFMDYDQRPMGGAGSLVSTVRAFAAAGIANKVVALFDHDTAASDALRNLNLRGLPENIRVLQYPHLALAEKYPTLGPPSEQFPGGRLDIADVNGLACSIELFLGRDVLVLPSGELRPVQWHSYVAGMQRYQGEVVDKGSLMGAYEAKLKVARSDPEAVASQDWSGIHAIIKLLIGAAGI